MKYYLSISGFFFILSLFTLFWAGHEMGIWGYADAEANEKAEEVSDASETKNTEVSASTKWKEVEAKESELKSKEKLLGDKESLLKEQIARYEKIVMDLRTQLAKKDDEIKRVKAERDQEVGKFKKQAEQSKAAQSDEVRTVYEKMDPKKSAKILEDMEPSLSTGILDGMKESSAAEILAKMNPEKARRITERLIGKARGLASTKVSKDSQPVNGVPENTPDAGSEASPNQE